MRSISTIRPFGHRERPKERPGREPGKQPRCAVDDDRHEPRPDIPEARSLRRPPPRPRRPVAARTVLVHSAHRPNERRHPGRGSRRSAARSPERAATRNASTTLRWTARSASGSGAPLRTRRLALLAKYQLAAKLRPTTVATSSNGRPKTSWSTNERRSGRGGRVSSTTSSARPTKSAMTALRLRDRFPSTARLTIGSGSQDPRLVRALGLCGGPAAHRGHFSPTTTVSQPRSSPRPPGSLRSSRTQASWTASSASVREPSIRYAIARRCGRSALELDGEPVASSPVLVLGRGRHGWITDRVPQT